MKLTIIGGGSPYMTSMLGAIVNHARDGVLKGLEIVLYDIHESAVKRMFAWAQIGVKNDGVDLKISYDMNMEKALQGADFVLSCIRPGGLEGRHIDESLPLKYRQLAIETVGVVGVFMGLRTIPVVYEIAKVIHRVCPDAWLINYTNPANMATDASIRAGHTRTLGLCDGVFGVKWLVARLLKMPIARAKEIRAAVAGVNHCTWTLKLSHEDRDLYREMDELIAQADLSGRSGYQCETESEYLDEVQADACRLYQYYKILPGSVYYSRYYYGLEKTIDHLLLPGQESRARWLQKVAAQKFQNIEKQIADGSATIAAIDAEDSAHGDQAIGVMAMIAGNTGGLETVNVVNHGAISCLPNDAVIEAECMVNAHSVVPLAHGGLPLSVDSIIRAAYTFAKLTVDAALTGDRNLVMQAVMASPMHRDIHVAEKIVKELFEAHKPWLKQFKY